VKLDTLPRMADFMLFGEAISRAMGEEAGHFADAFLGNREEADGSAVDDSPIATAIMTFAAKKQLWTGSAAELLTELGEIVGDRATQHRGWPQTPRAMAAFVKTWAPKLRRLGVKAERGRRRERFITIERISG
jgi:hypothetical protein